MEASFLEGHFLEVASIILLYILLFIICHIGTSIFNGGWEM